MPPALANDPAQPIPPALVHEAQTPALDLKVGEETYAGAISLPLEDDRTVVNLGSGKGPVPVCVIDAQRETCFTLLTDETRDVVIRFGGDEKTLVFSYLGPQASFSPEYQAAHRGTLDIEIPVAYELVNVAIALTDYAKENPGLVAVSPYLGEVRSRFESQAGHPVIVSLDKLMREDADSYHTLKMNGGAFDLADDNLLSRSPVYKSMGWKRNDLLPLMEQLQDFANATKFAQFYAEHQTLYSTQIAYLRDDVDVGGMIAWLESEFPNVNPYDHIRILFSPLVGFNQSVKSFEEDDFRQLIPHVNFPYPEAEDAELSAPTLTLYRGLILFTELNHGYINPTIDPFSASLQAAMPDLSVWARDDTVQAYDTSTAIFTEMTNWALVSVRAYDVLPEEDAGQIAKRIERIMVNNRGFKRFAAFQERFLELSRARAKGVSVGSVIPALVESQRTTASR